MAEGTYMNGLKIASLVGILSSSFLISSCGNDGASVASDVDIHGTIAARVDATFTAGHTEKLTLVPTRRSRSVPMETPTGIPVNTSTPIPTDTPVPITFTNENWNLALADSDSYIGSRVDLLGRVFTEPETDSGIVSFQIFTDPENSEGNTVIAIRERIKVKKDDYVHIIGSILNEFKGSNAFGGSIIAPLVMAEKVDVVSREQVVAPALKIVEVNHPITQHKLTILLQKIEIAANETRVHVKVQNQAVDNARVYDNDAKLVQGSKQLDARYVSNSDYPDLPSEILTGIEAETVLVFDAIQPSGTLRLVWDGPHTENYRLDFAPYSWTVRVE
jgi:hypothetical protein